MGRDEFGYIFVGSSKKKDQETTEVFNTTEPHLKEQSKKGLMKGSSISCLSHSDAILVKGNLWLFHGFWRDQDCNVDDVYVIKDVKKLQKEVFMVVGKTRRDFIHPDHLQPLESYRYIQHGHLPGKV